MNVNQKQRIRKKNKSEGQEIERGERGREREGGMTTEDVEERLRMMKYGPDHAGC